MPELPADLDLKMMPDWLKEPATKNPYADYEGRDEDRRGRGGDWGDRQDRRGGKPGGQAPRGGGRRDDRGVKAKSASQGRKPDGGRREGAARPEGRSGKYGEQRRTDGPRGEARQQPAPQVEPANVTIEFFPEEGAAASIAKQIKSTHRAYSLFDLARMFLAKPERHWLKITAKSVAEPLYQVGENGPVSIDKAAAERAAFPLMRKTYYVEVTETRESPKGNFTNVARCRANGVLLGPTNYHGYQPALRKLFEERFSRRMTFAEFQREIEVVNDPALVEQWKQQASTATVYHLRPPESPAKEEQAKPEAPAAEHPAPVAAEAEPQPVAEAPADSPTETVAEAAPDPSEPEPPPAETPAAQVPPPAYDGPVFATLNDVERHFRENYLPSVIRTASSCMLTGEASRAASDRGIAAAIRQAWEQERGFPGQVMHQLRQQFSRHGLHVFKHRKRMQFVSLIRPSPMESGSLSPTVAEIIGVIQGNPNCTRLSLAAAILGTDENAVDATRKTMLATDLHWLIETGRVIEFSDGKLELPVTPQKAPEKPVAEAAKPGTTAPEAVPAPMAGEAGTVTHEPGVTEEVNANPASVHATPEAEPAGRVEGPPLTSDPEPPFAAGPERPPGHEPGNHGEALTSESASEPVPEAIP